MNPSENSISWMFSALDTIKHFLTFIFFPFHFFCVWGGCFLGHSQQWSGVIPGSTLSTPDGPRENIWDFKSWSQVVCIQGKLYYHFGPRNFFLEILHSIFFRGKEIFLLEKCLDICIYITLFQHIIQADGLCAAEKKQTWLCLSCLAPVPGFMNLLAFFRPQARCHPSLVDTILIWYIYLFLVFFLIQVSVFKVSKSFISLIYAHC